MMQIEKVRLYPIGFVFTDKPSLSVPDYYREEIIINKYYYYFDKESEHTFYEKEGFFIIIHGHYVHISSDGSTSTDILPDLLSAYKHDYIKFLDTLDFIGGRFAIIIGNKDNVQIYPDASHARTVYYSENSFIASSHINLLASIENSTENKIANKIHLLKNHWNSTPYDGLKSLNPNFTVNLQSKERERFFPREANKYSSWTHAKRLELLSTLWKSNMRHYNDNYDNIILSITGGFDSRVMLAMAREYIDNLKFFTYSTTEGENETSKYSRVLSVDQYVVKQMLRDINLNHQFFYFDQKLFNLSKEQTEILDINTIGNNGKFLINFYLHSFPEKNVMHIRGTLLEIGRAYYSKYHENSEKSVQKNFINAIKNDMNNIPERDLLNLISNYTSLFGYDKEIFDYHLLDLYYWENRMGRWHPEILNENDICFDTFLPLNIRAMLDITLSYTREERIKGFVFEELINKNFPILNFYGKNEKENLYEKNRNKYLDSLLNDSKVNGTMKNQGTSIDRKNILTDKFNKMDIYENNAVITNLEMSDNCLFIPIEHFRKQKHTQLDLEFSKGNGTMNIVYKNYYQNKNAKNYVYFEIFLNKQKILSEDISEWSNEITIEIYNLVKGDTISFVLKPVRNISNKSWQTATKHTFLKVEENSTSVASPVKIVSTNPFAKVY